MKRRLDQLELAKRRLPFSISSNLKLPRISKLKKESSLLKLYKKRGLLHTLHINPRENC
jgi:hypothetical protein